MRTPKRQTNYQVDLSPDEHRDMKVLARLVYGQTLRDFMTAKVKAILAMNKAAIDSAKRTLPLGTDLDDVLEGKTTKFHEPNRIF